MIEAIVERVKKRLRQFHMEEVLKVDDEGNIVYLKDNEGNPILDDEGNPVAEKTSIIVFDKLEDNPLIEECVLTNIDWLCNKIGKEFDKFDEEEFFKKYSSALAEFTLYDLVKEGGEYEKSHSENGVNRTYNSKDDIFNSYGLSCYVKFL